MMRKAMSISLVLVLALSTVALARPADETGSLDKFKFMDMSGQGSDVLRTSPTVFGTAQAGTTWYGGTYWAADSMRWEALEDSVWTFDTGVGSDIAGSSSSPYVDPNKNASLHGQMEGWIGYDNSFSEITYFRRLDSGTTPCVGAAAGLGGTWSLYAGVLPSEAVGLCYAAGGGYGNNWNVCVGQQFNYTGGGTVTLAYDYVNETEGGYDFTTVIVDTSGTGDDVDIVAYDGATGVVSESLSLTNAAGQLPPAAGPIVIKFCVTSDGAWSDSDGLNPTVCGAFAVDNIVIGGGVVHSADFESGDNGWTLLPPTPGPGGEWSNIVHLDDLPPPLTPCVCALSESVLVFEDQLVGGHGRFQDNLAASPWIDLGPDGYNNQGPG